MKDFERIRAIKRAAQGRLLAIPGVHAVGVGSKIVAGEFTKESAIMVFVVKKRPLSELPANQVIPAEIEGVKTDVYESGVFRRHAEDEKKYRDPLMAGSRLFMGGVSGQVTIRHPPDPDFVIPAKGLGGIGTLGCFARTGGTNPQVLGITCQHVVGSPTRAEPTSLTVSFPGSGFTFTGSNTPGTLVVVFLGVSGRDLSAYYTTSATDTLATIATAVAARINGLASPGLSATAAGAQVTVTAPGAGSLDCQIFGPHATNTWSDIHASVTGTAISLTGTASDRGAAYVTLNLGGARPTFSIFVPIADGASANTVAGSILTAITARNLPGVTAIEMMPVSPGDPVIVSVSGVQEVECDISNDMRVGQPTNSFCSKCSKCCDDRIGVVIDAHLDLDVALIQLDPDYVEKYRAEIQDIGIVRGIHDIHLETPGYALQKRGQTTLHTHGKLLALDVDGDTSENDPNTPPAWHLYGCHYTGAFTIKGDSGKFGDHGDSGAAVLNNNSEVVGILFAGDSAGNIATPIQQILSAFPALNLSIEVATAPGVDKTVPAAAMAVADAQIATERRDTVLTARLAQAQQELTATPKGRLYSELVQRHFPEAQKLVNTNKRVATAWRRNGGPQIVRDVLRMLQSPEGTLPHEIERRPLSECLSRIQRVFARYGSSELAADLAEYGPPLAQLAGLNYSQALDTLRNMHAQ
jgi:hypothetical protein